MTIMDRRLRSAKVAAQVFAVLTGWVGIHSSAAAQSANPRLAQATTINMYWPRNSTRRA